MVSPKKLRQYQIVIYGNSNHPIEIKKIALNIWTLRDELEIFIQEKLKTSPLEDFQQLNLDDLLQEYKKTSSPLSTTPLHPSGIPGSATSSNENSNTSQTPENNSSSIPDDLNLDNSEDEMARALAEAAGESKPIEESPPSSSTNPEKDITGNINQENESASSNSPNNQSNSESTLDDSLIFKKRITVPPEKISSGVCFLADINMQEISFFSRLPFVAGQSVIIEFLIPTHFLISAEVITCQNFNFQSRIISDIRPQYRLRAKFTFDRPGERAYLRKFVTSIQPEISNTQSSSQGDNKKSEDLGDFDF